MQILSCQCLTLGIACALGFSEASGIPYREGLIKNRYMHRSFIQPVNEQRKATISEKLNPIKEIVEGKKGCIS